ncbi:MAG: hypothetical protein OHK0029_39220 [Armatimonadaceae bacterium]
MTTTVLVSREISCEGCANAIQNSVGRMEGVEELTVDIPDQRVTIHHNDAVVTQDELVEAMDEAGFPVEAAA